MAKHISKNRRNAYYIGTALMILGGISFASAFVTFVVHFRDFSNFVSTAKATMLRAFGGMALMIIGGIVRAIGARGLAGSGVVLDPDKARHDLEPYARMAGGMVKDALEQTNVNTGPHQVVMIKCPSCGKLNNADSKFCQECGKQI
jgi:hypothetical protein